MGDPNASESGLGHRPVSILFIDNQLPKHHNFFMSPPVHYDLTAGEYVPNMPKGKDSVALMSRPAPTNINAMKFWEDIFPKAMAELNATPEPKRRSETIYNIRDKCSWDAVYGSLQEARLKYENGEGPTSKIREGWRKVATTIAPLGAVVKIASKVVPDNTCATPVLGALQVLLDAVKIAAALHQKVLGSFDDNISIFSDVELFLGTFPNDENILNASLDLTVATLKGIELAIGFFISNAFIRGGKALLSSDYEKTLLEALDLIKSKSESLMKEALKSHIHELHIYSEETYKLSKNVQSTVERVEKKVQHGFNSIHHLLSEHVKEKERILEATQRKLEAAHQENYFLRAENNTLRAYSPFQTGSPYLPPQTEMSVTQWYISQDILQRTIDVVDIDIFDMAFVGHRKGQFPSKERLSAEQIVSTQLFRNWIVSPVSSKLLIHWDFRLPKIIAGVSPLSVFCMTMTQALRVREGFVSLLWFCGRHINPAESGGCVGGRGMIASLVDQLLEQHTFDTRSLSTNITLAGLQEGNLDTLIELLCYLVRQLPPTVTLFIIVDNAALFERDEFELEALQVFSILIRLSHDTNVPAAIKLLFTSTPGTKIIRGAFENENLILNVDRLPQMAWAPNDERMMRELDGRLA